MDTKCHVHGKKVSVFSKKGLLQEKCQWKKSVFSAEKGNVFIKKSVEKGVKFAAVTVMGPIYDVEVPAPGLKYGLRLALKSEKRAILTLYEIL